MGDDTVIVVPEVSEPEPIQIDNTRDEILIQFGELSAKVAQLEKLYARCEGLELQLRLFEDRLNGQESSRALYALIGHEHPEYALKAEISESTPLESESEEEPERKPESQNFWFRKLGQ